MGFDEKLKVVKEIYLGDFDYSISEGEIKEIEIKLNFNLPIPLKKFYLMFGKGGSLLSSYYKIAIPQELYIEDNILMFAGEYQGVCSYGINIDTKELMYIDNYINEPMNDDLEDFLLYLLAIQGTEFFPRSGIIYSEVSEVEKHLIKITDSNNSVYYNKNGIIAFHDGKEFTFSAKDDDCFEKFVNDSNLDIEYL